MSYFPDTTVKFSDSSNMDAFQRLRTSQPYTLFDSQLQHNEKPFLWETQLTGGGTSIHQAPVSSVDMGVTTAAGDKVIRQSRQYIRYQPGKSQLVLLTGAFGAGHPYCRKRIGYFDANDGLYFEEVGGILSVVRRSSISGSVVETNVQNSLWNLDKLDGTGPSGISIDSSAAHIFLIDLEWLGVGRVRMGFVFAGKIIYVHEFLHANIAVAPYMATANLPVRYEIENTGILPSPLSFRQICTTVIAEGGYERTGYSFSASNQITAKSVGTTLIPLISIRPKLIFNGIINRGFVVPSEHSISTASQTILVEIRRNPTLGGTVTWSSANTNSIVEYNTSATTVSGGEAVSSFYIPAAQQGGGRPGSIRAEILSKIFLSLNINGDASTIYSICARTTNSTSNTYASINWQEFY